MSVALGIDASLRAAGLVAIPFDWGCDWSRVARATVGEALPQHASVIQQVRRVVDIVHEVRSFARRHNVTHVWMEDYAFDGSQRAHSLGELGGAVKAAVVVDLALPLVTVTASAARKLLGTMPRAKAKDHAHTLLTRAGAPLEWTRDELDAFLAANWGLSGIKGADALILEVPEVSQSKRNVRIKRVRARAEQAGGAS
jgi:hypothetical protein